ncbi:unnamed protein product [Caenorhabditis angaria]|uniref:T-box domain-containing protein n=1 Tax=Caenorhabditis angaria TaxID=860376 RepID=A0A9P1N0E7_9PELO|nr:unnamed protein product [Caenorhabditis angaria]
MKSEVIVRLAEQQDALWKRFAAHTTEMVVTKTGRKMFPKLEYHIEGLETDKMYALVLEIRQVDDYRYKFSNGGWVTAGRCEGKIEEKKIWHADGVMTGKQWMSTAVNFDRLKITNNSKDTCASHVFLHSMHKYIPVLSIFESPSNSPFLMPQQTSKPIAVVKIDYTDFIAVTAYQNQTVTSLKIAHNPFAKGFREGTSTPTQESRKRNSSSTPEDSQVSSPQPKRIKSEHPLPPTIPQILPFAPNPFMLPYSPFLFQAMVAASGGPQIPFFHFGPTFSPTLSLASSNSADSEKDVDLTP